MDNEKKLESAELSVTISDSKENSTVSETTVPRDGNAPIIRRTKFMFPQYWGLVAAMLVLAVGTVLMLHFLSPDKVDTADESNGTPVSTSTQEPTQAIPLADGVRWFVPPQFDYDQGIAYCDIRDVFTYSEMEDMGYCEEIGSYMMRLISENSIDKWTGEVTDIIIPSIPRYSIWQLWLYDTSSGMFGRWQIDFNNRDVVEFHTAEEFSYIAPAEFNRAIIVAKVDYAEFVDSDFDSLLEFTNYFSESALVYHGEFVTDFIYGNAWMSNSARDVTTLTTVACQNFGMLGVVNNLGEMVVPFNFSNLMIIDEHSAFARGNNGKWGIIALCESETRPPMEDTIGGFWAGNLPLPPHLDPSVLIPQPCYICDPPPMPPTPPMPDISAFEGISWFLQPRHLGWYYYSWDGEWVQQNTNYQWWTDSFHSTIGRVLDERTMQHTANWASVGGFGTTPRWFYDADLGLFGRHTSSCSHSVIEMYPIAEFAERFPHDADYVLIANLVDSTLRGGEEYGDREWFADEAILGKTAVFYKGEFVTEFASPGECHDFQWHGRGRLTTAVIALHRDGKQGIVNRRGETLVPFIFEELLVIDNYTAFAYVGDYHWGIITWIDVDDVPHRETTGGEGPWENQPCTIIIEQLNTEMLEEFAQSYGHISAHESLDLFIGFARDVFVGLEQTLTIEEFNEMFGTQIIDGAFPHWMEVFTYHNNDERSCRAFSVSMQFRDTIRPDTPLMISR
jgi:hypothetical protein